MSKNLKITSIVLSIGFAIVILSQFEAIANLSPIFFTIRKVVQHTFFKKTETTQQIILTNEPQLLNSEHTDETTTQRRQKISVPTPTKMNTDRSENYETYFSDLLNSDSDFVGQRESETTGEWITEIWDQNSDPVTELFPETISENELESEFFLETIPEDFPEFDSETPIDLDEVQSLLDEIRSDVQKAFDENSFYEDTR